MGLPASSRPKDEGKRERRKTKHQKFEAVYNRRGPWGPPAGSRPKEKERERTNNYWHLSGSLCSWRL